MAYWVNVNALRREVHNRRKLDLEIMKLKEEVDRSELNRVKLGWEIRKLCEDAERQARSDAKAERLIREFQVEREILDACFSLTQ
ncbi:hypothetical protein BG61_29515 [Caballeronia glathei]|uniref:Uncharacterized protein n=2 Tax=Caballeronia glathei TaxID=60547 RepID=A0A069PGM2_9BURK|nr:hypothetical protein BG61_29515 [Caballeronia glathei]